MTAFVPIGDDDGVLARLQLLIQAETAAPLRPCS